MAELKQTNITGGLEVVGNIGGDTFEVRNKIALKGAKITGTDEVNIAVGANDLLDLLYPVGSIYITVNENAKNSCPLAALGGSWTRIKHAFLYAADDSDMDNTYAATFLKDHGSNDAVVVSHDHTGSIDTATADISIDSGRPTLSDGNDPWFDIKRLDSDNDIFAGVDNQKFFDGRGKTYHQRKVCAAGTKDHESERITFKGDHSHGVTDYGHRHELTVDWKGEDGTNKNMPKHVRVYMWRRTA